MKNKLMYPLIVAAFVACGGSDRSKTDQAAANYETVQEGSAAGVTSTIQGPGETVPPLTGTNADTTSAFTLNPNAVPPAGQMPTGGTLVGTLPTDFPSSSGMPAGTTYRPPVTRTAPSSPAPRPAAAQPATQPMYSSAPAQPQQQPQTATTEPEPPPADTTSTQQQPPPPADTTATQPPPQTQSAPPAEQKPKKEEKPPAEGDGDAEAEETAPPPPPPPGRQ